MLPDACGAERQLVTRAARRPGFPRVVVVIAARAIGVVMTDNVRSVDENGKPGTRLSLT